jgi:hypothetical protein
MLPLAAAHAAAFRMLQLAAARFHMLPLAAAFRMLPLAAAFRMLQLAALK